MKHKSDYTIAKSASYIFKHSNQQQFQEPMLRKDTLSIEILNVYLSVDKQLHYKSIFEMLHTTINKEMNTNSKINHSSKPNEQTQRVWKYALQWPKADKELTGRNQKLHQFVRAVNKYS